jgi:hypothetical protein
MTGGTPGYFHVYDVRDLRFKGTHDINEGKNPDLNLKDIDIKIQASRRSL